MGEGLGVGAPLPVPLGVAEGVAEGDAEQRGPVAQVTSRTFAASPTNSVQPPSGPSATAWGFRKSEKMPASRWLEAPLPATVLTSPPAVTLRTRKLPASPT